MNVNLLILGGTTEARQLARAIANRAIHATLSYAGRVERPRNSAIPHRMGGFGGIEGLVEYINSNAITHLIDATHPFAAQMSNNAIAACAIANIPLVALTRPPWKPTPDDRWQSVPDIAAAVAELAGPPRRVFLAIGRQNLDAFTAQTQHHYVLRLVDPPVAPPPLPHHDIIVSRGPFERAGDIDLMRTHGVDLVVAKNAGGTGAVAKLEAARQLALPVIMIERPVLPCRYEVETIDEVFHWLDHATT